MPIFHALLKELVLSHILVPSRIVITSAFTVKRKIIIVLNFKQLFQGKENY